MQPVTTGGWLGRVLTFRQSETASGDSVHTWLSLVCIKRMRTHLNRASGYLSKELDSMEIKESISGCSLNLVPHASATFYSVICCMCCMNIRYYAKRYDAIRYILFKTIQHDTTQYNILVYNTIWYNTIQRDTTQYDAIQHDTIQHDTIQCDTTRYDTTRYDTI